MLLQRCDIQKRKKQTTKQQRSTLPKICEHNNKKRVRNCNEGGQSLVRTSSCSHSELKRGKNSWSSDTRSNRWEAAGGGRKIAVANLLYRAKLACKCLLYYTRAAFWYIRQEIGNFSKPPSQQHKSMKNKKKQETKTSLLFPITSAAQTHTPRKKHTHTLTHPKPCPHRVREQEPKIKERITTNQK